MNIETVRSAQLEAPKAGMASLRRLRRAGHYGLKALTLGLVALAALMAIGFFRFTDEVAAILPPADLDTVDAIVVLTGGYQRIDQAVDLLETGVGKRLLISGVNPATSGAALKRLTGANDALFACCVDIGYEALDTIGNANETARWIREKGYHRVLLVTNNYHMPRSLLELGDASPNVTFVAYPVSNSDLRDEAWLSDPEAMRILVTEYVKYSVARLRAYTGARSDSGLRTDLPSVAKRVTATVGN